MGVIFYQDNEKRGQRVKQLASHIETIEGEIKANQAKFEVEECDLIKKLRGLREQLAQIGEIFRQAGKPEVVEKIRQMVAKLERWVSPEEVTIGGINVTIFGLLAESVIGITAGSYAAGAMRSALSEWYLIRALRNVGPRQGFALRFPGWIRTLGGVGGAVVGGLVAAAVQSLFDLFDGPELKEELQKKTRDCLNLRFRALKIKLGGDAALATIQQLTGKADVYSDLLRDAEDEAQLQKTIDYIAGKLDCVKAQLHGDFDQINIEAVVTRLKEFDQNVEWVDHEVEDGWSPPTSDEDLESA